MLIKWDTKGYDIFSETDSFYWTKTAPDCSIKAFGDENKSDVCFY
ncbi:MAG: hypothetical protein ABIH71_02755 [Candidatus Omnitrophota bacterium]